MVPLHLLSLPKEIRLEIYDHLLRPQDPPIPWAERTRPFLTCHQIHAEAQSALLRAWENQIFTFRCPNYFITQLQSLPSHIPRVKHVKLDSPVIDFRLDPLDILVSPRRLQIQDINLKTLTLLCDCSGTEWFIRALPRLNYILQENQYVAYCTVWKKLRPYMKRGQVGEPPVLHAGGREYVVTGGFAAEEGMYLHQQNPCLYVTLTLLEGS
jgi:hypothetical protein